MSAHEAVAHTACVRKYPTIDARRVDAFALRALARARARARNIEINEAAVRLPQRAVVHVVPIHVGSRDRTLVVHGPGVSPLTVAVPMPGASNSVSIPSGVAHEAVSRAIRVSVSIP